MRCLALSLGLICQVLFAGPSWASPPPHIFSAVGDTINLFGGPGTLQGKFETAENLPDQQNWITRDDNAPVNTYWKIDRYQAANLDPAVPGNHAWWCGEMFPACTETDSVGGYGNSWDTSLAWTGTVQDNSLPATITVTGVLNSDTENGFDFAYLRAVTNGGTYDLLSLDGIWTGLTFTESFVYQPDDYLGENADEVQIRIQFVSDSGWSDEDCNWPTAGGIQVDNLQVTIQQQGVPELTSPVESCEPGDVVGWEPLPILGVGDFAQLWTDLDDLDPDQDNHSPQWAFLDDGIVVPGTGGSYCEFGFWCYGPDSLVTNRYGGLLGPGNFLRNSVTSPAIALPPVKYTELVVSFDAYLHNEINMSYYDPVFLSWDLEATNDPAALAGWQACGNPFAYMSEEGGYRRISGSVSAGDLPTGVLFARIVITAGQIPIWDWGIHYSTPAPYFDNVRLQAVPYDSAAPVEGPAEFLQVYFRPNPFNPTVEIRYSLPRSSDLSIRIYDLSGELVRTLRSGLAESGPGSVFWHGDNEQGQGVSAGVYLCRVTAGAESTVKKLLLLK